MSVLVKNLVLLGGPLLSGAAPITSFNSESWSVVGIDQAGFFGAIDASLIMCGVGSQSELFCAGWPESALIPINGVVSGAWIHTDREITFHGGAAQLGDDEHTLWQGYIINDQIYYANLTWSDGKFIYSDTEWLVPGDGGTVADFQIGSTSQNLVISSADNVWVIDPNSGDMQVTEAQSGGQTLVVADTVHRVEPNAMTIELLVFGTEVKFNSEGTATTAKSTQNTRIKYKGSLNLGSSGMFVDGDGQIHLVSIGEDECSQLLSVIALGADYIPESVRLGRLHTEVENMSVECANSVCSITGTDNEMHHFVQFEGDSVSVFSATPDGHTSLRGISNNHITGVWGAQGAAFDGVPTDCEYELITFSGGPSGVSISVSYEEAGAGRAIELFVDARTEAGETIVYNPCEGLLTQEPTILNTGTPVNPTLQKTSVSTNSATIAATQRASNSPSFFPTSATDLQTTTQTQMQTSSTAVPDPTQTVEKTPIATSSTTTRPTATAQPTSSDVPDSSHLQWLWLLLIPAGGITLVATWYFANREKESQISLIEKTYPDDVVSLPGATPPSIPGHELPARLSVHSKLARPDESLDQTQIKFRRSLIHPRIIAEHQSLIAVNRHLKAYHHFLLAYLNAFFHANISIASGNAAPSEGVGSTVLKCFSWFSPCAKLTHVTAEAARFIQGVCTRQTANNFLVAGYYSERQYQAIIETLARLLAVEQRAKIELLGRSSAPIGLFSSMRRRVTGLNRGHNSVECLAYDNLHQLIHYWCAHVRDLRPQPNPSGNKLSEQDIPIVDELFHVVLPNQTQYNNIFTEYQSDSDSQIQGECRQPIVEEYRSINSELEGDFEEEKHAYTP